MRRDNSSQNECSPADLVVRNGTVAFVRADEYRQRDVVVTNGRITGLLPDAEAVIGESTTVISANGKTVVPGLVDAHTHLDLHQAVEQAYPQMLEHGTTSVLSEVAEFGSLYGATGVTEFLRATDDLPLMVRVALPPQPFLDTFVESSLSAAQKTAIRNLLTHPRVAGIGEIDWIHAMVNYDTIKSLAKAAKDAGGRVTGHAAGCSGRNLESFATLVDNDHEPITAEQVVERLRNGLHVVGRSGSVRDDLDAFTDAWTPGRDAALSMSSDGMWPRELVRDGYMDQIVAELVKSGIPELAALRAVTCTPADFFGFTDRGSIAPGNYADLLVVDEIASMDVQTVVVEGSIVVDRGKATVDSRPYRYPDSFYRGANLKPTTDWFTVLTRRESPHVRTINHRKELLTESTITQPPVEDGRLCADPDNDLLLATLINRNPRTDATRFTGFISGLGFEGEALATTVTWEVPGMLVIGATSESMARAARALVRQRGGWVVDDGTTQKGFPLEVGGLIADRPPADTAMNYEKLDRTLCELGIGASKPTLAIQTLTTPGVPELKLAFTGYADVRSGEIRSLWTCER